VNVKHLVTLCLAALVPISCAYGIKVRTDYDRTANFAKYHTFFILKGTSSGNAVMDDQIESDVKAALADREWLAVPRDEGEAVVVAHASTKTKHSYETFYDGWGGWRWRWGGAVGPTTIVEDYQVGTLVVDIFDARTKQAIWHGFATDAVSDDPIKNANRTQDAIDKMFKNFPPTE
jgi:hypothetical protein